MCSLEEVYVILPNGSVTPYGYKAVSIVLPSKLNLSLFFKVV